MRRVFAILFVSLAGFVLCGAGAPPARFTAKQQAERDRISAALNAIQRSIITPMDHPDMMNRMTTTIFARMPICFHSETGSHPTAPSWNMAR